MKPRDIVYHGSPSDFDAFDPDRFGQNPERASNGALGVWVTDDPDVARRFAGDGVVMTLSVAAESNWLMPIRHLVELHECAGDMDQQAATSFYDAIRRKAIASGHDMIWIVENDGTAPTRICLDPADIRIVEKTPARIVAETTTPFDMQDPAP